MVHQCQSDRLNFFVFLFFADLGAGEESAYVVDLVDTTCKKFKTLDNSSPYTYTLRTYSLAEALFRFDSRDIHIGNKYPDFGLHNTSVTSFFKQGFLKFSTVHRNERRPLTWRLNHLV